MAEKITLMNKNTPVLEILGEIKDSETELYPQLMIKDAKYINKELCPPGIFHDDNSKSKRIFIEQILKWFKKRNISEKRADLKILKEKQIKWDGNPNFFSMTDQYWLRFNENEKWQDLNFFSNKYNTYLGDACFSKNLDYIKTINLCWHTPDITTNGVLKKRWITKQTLKNDKTENSTINKNILVKSMSKEFGQEPLSEILASKLLEKLNIIPFVKYSLYIEGYELCSGCENFISPDVEFVPAAAPFTQLPIKGGTKEDRERRQKEPNFIYEHLIESIDYFNIPNAKEFIDNMIIADRLMMNFDRHLGNFGYLRDVETGKYIGPAPLFDFGNAFFADVDTYKNKAFEVRENELFKNGKIKPLDKEVIDAFVQEIKDCPLLSFDKKKKIARNLNENNKDIQKKTIESKQMGEKSMKNRKGKDVRFCDNVD